MATAVSAVGPVNTLPLKINGSRTGVTSVPSSAFLGKRLKKVSSKISQQHRILSKIVSEYEEEKQTSKDRWGGLAYDTSDDQQDITRGKGMVDTLIQAPMESGTHYAVMSSYDYISTSLRQFLLSWVFGEAKVKESHSNVSLSLPRWESNFFGALRARVYDDEVRKWISEIGIESVGKRLVNSKEGPPTFEQPKMTLEKLLEYGSKLVQEQENVKRVQLADKYLSEAALGDANDDAIKNGSFYGKSANYDPTARSDDGSCNYQS